MGIDYNQSCILGIKIEESDYAVCTKETVWKSEKRYDRKTGERIEDERSVVTEAEYIVSYMDVEGYDEWDLAEKLAKKLGLTYCMDDNGTGCDIYIGYSLGGSDDYGRVDLIDGSVSMEDFASKLSKLTTIFNSEKIELHFVSSAG